jgi:hypothetical protein
MQNLAHSASLQASEKSAPSKSGIKHLVGGSFAEVLDNDVGRVVDAVGVALAEAFDRVLATGGGNFAAASFNFAAFGPSAGGWTSQDRYPREMADVNGDGRSDIVGFGEAGVYVATSDGDGTLQPASLDLAAFGRGAGGWTSQDTYPRHLADRFDDIVGFGEAGTYVALSNAVLLI